MIGEQRQGRQLAQFGSAVAGLAALLAGCAGQGSGSPAPTITDSAGVRIMEYTAWAPDSLPWSVSEAAIVEMGALEGDEAYQFSQIRGVARLSDGRIVVANGGTQELRFFDPTGRHLRTTGRKGEGPGEFLAPGVLAVLPGDSVAVYDWNLQRMSVFDPTGTFVRSFALQHSAGVAFPIGRFAQGSWLLQPGFTFSPGGTGTTVVRDTSQLLVFGPDGVMRDSAGRWIGPDFYIQSEAQHASAVSLPFGRRTAVAVTGDRFYTGYTERYEIARRDAGGAADLVIRVRRANAPLAATDIDAHKARQLADADAQWRPRLERLYQDIPFPATLPAFDDLQVDPDGNLWVLEARRPADEQRRWVVFDPDGKLLGAIATPPAVSIREIGRDYLLGTWSDDLDVEHVRVYRLDRAAR